MRPAASSHGPHHSACVITGDEAGCVDQMAGWLCRRRASLVDGSRINRVRRPVARRYVAQVPELSAGRPPIPGLPWESLSHRQVLAELAAGGWVPCGVGDWAVADRGGRCGVPGGTPGSADDRCAVPESTPWRGRCDLDDARIFRAAGGRPVLIDVFCMAGTELYRAILEDAAGVHRRIPHDQMRYALDIPYIARENSTAEILALKKAWARAAR